MDQIYDDLWQTKLETPFAGIQTHAYILQGSEGNVLLYNTSHADEIQHIAELGGIKYQCLSHRDEAGESLLRIKNRLGSRLCCHVKEEPSVARSCRVDIAFSEPNTRIFYLESIHTPGHTDGSVSFVYRSPHGRTYFFTGDTCSQSNGSWETFVMAQAGGSTESLIESLRLYRDLNPDVVLSSAFSSGSAPLVELSTEEWVNAIDNTIVGLENQDQGEVAN
jgi:hydroxyacylglutathione hydrolase